MRLEQQYRFREDKLNDDNNTNAGKELGWWPSQLSAYETPRQKGIATISRGNNDHPSPSIKRTSLSHKIAEDGKWWCLIEVDRDLVEAIELDADEAKA